MNTLLFLLALAGAAAPAQVHRRPVTVDDLMRMRSITDVRIAPDGERVAFVVSTPSLTKNEHEAALYVVNVRGGEPKRIGESVRLFNAPLPRASCRWFPDSSAVALVGFAGDKPQVFSIPIAGGDAKALTDAPEGAGTFELSPDGKRIAFISSNGRAEIMAPRSLTVVAVDGGAPRLFLMNDAWVNEIAWAHDGQSVYATTNDGTFASHENMFDQPIVRVRVDSG